MVRKKTKPIQKEQLTSKNIMNLFLILLEALKLKKITCVFLLKALSINNFSFEVVWVF